MKCRICNPVVPRKVNKLESKQGEDFEAFLMNAGVGMASSQTGSGSSRGQEVLCDRLVWDTHFIPRERQFFGAFATKFAFIM